MARLNWLNVGWVDPDAYVAQCEKDGWSVIDRKDTAILIQTVVATPGNRTGSRAWNLLTKDEAVEGQWLLSVTNSIRAAKQAFKAQ